jgi:hypothetical protein
MEGTIIWYSPLKTQGIIAVTENGQVQKYFLLKSRIARSPEVVKTGQFAKFLAFAPPPKLGLLPVALAVEISNLPFVDDVQAGANALAGSAE